MYKLLADVFSCAIMQKPVAFSVLIIALEGEGTERVTTNLRGNAARQGDGLSVVQHRTGDEIAAQTQSEAPALWVIALENH
jgi:hypothetical protein